MQRNNTRQTDNFINKVSTVIEESGEISALNIALNWPFYIAFGAAKLGAAGLKTAKDLSTSNKAAAVSENSLLTDSIASEEYQTPDQLGHNDQLAGEIPPNYGVEYSV
jgi:hypothetical protein